MKAESTRGARERAGKGIVAADREVLGLEQRPDGPTFWFHELRQPLAPVNLYRMGTGAYCDIVVENGDGVTEMHCSILRTAEGVEVKDFQHPGHTLINKAAIVDGHAMLYPGCVLQLGETRFMARGRDANQAPDITASDMPGMMREGLALHGKGSKLAEAIEAPKRRRTVYRRLAELGIALAVFFGVLQWHGSESSPRPGSASMEQSEVQVPAATATVTGVPAIVEERLPPEPSPTERPSDKPSPTERPSDEPAIDDPLTRESTLDKDPGERSTSTRRKETRTLRRKTATSQKSGQAVLERDDAELGKDASITATRNSSRVIQDIPWKSSRISWDITGEPTPGSAAGGGP